jgi:hypothetical protein
MVLETTSSLVAASDDASPAGCCEKADLTNWGCVTGVRVVPEQKMEWSAGERNR